MMRKTARLGASLLALAATAACSDQAIQPTAPVVRLDSPASGASAAPRLQLDRDRALPGVVASIVDHRFARVAGGGGAINPDDYVCSDESAVTDYLLAAVDRTLGDPADAELFLTAYFDYDAGNVPYYEALYLQSSAQPQVFGSNGEYTKVIGKTERDLKRFWDIESAGIEVVAMNGNVLADTARTAATFRYVYGIPAPLAAVYAAELRAIVTQATTFPDGDHPYFTFNAVAASFASGLDKIIVGEGILDAYEAIGFGDVAPQAIFAHEFAHHVQFDNGYRLTDPTATAGERTRFGELSADFMAAYYLTHKHGGTLNQKRVEQFLTVFYEIGDCGFESSGHHGTPNQRLAAARLGFQLADEAQKQGHILPAAEVHARFLAAYPTLIAPDAP